MMKKGATIFSGFEGVGVGMRAAGIHHAWGIEWDNAIADAARANGFNTLTANILDVDPASFERVDVLHASPPCPSFSVAKTNGVETELDIALARKTADFIEVLRPKYFTLENVYAYRNSQSWGIISNRLYTCGYWLDFEHVNAADYGVPQTRQRMIVRAVHNGFVPYLPKKEKWIGWYEAIEDLIPTLPASAFAPWQLERLPMELRETFIMEPTEMRDDGSTRRADEPIMTIKASRHENFRAFLVNESSTMEFREMNEPVATQIASERNLSQRAFLVNTNQSGNEGETVQVSYESEPAFTIKTSDIGRSRAWLSQGRVIKMTARALARFQSFPDSYTLPAKNSLACKGIGNACPPLLMEKIYKGLLFA